MGFFNNVGVSIAYLFDIMEFDKYPAYDIGNEYSEPHPGDVIEKSIVHDGHGNITVSIKRENQRRARKLRFTLADVINTIETETPQYKGKKISRIVLTPAYYYNTYGYTGKAINMVVDFGDCIATRGNGYMRGAEIFTEIFEHSHRYYFGHKNEEYAKYYDRNSEE